MFVFSNLAGSQLDSGVPNLWPLRDILSFEGEGEAKDLNIKDGFEAKSSRINMRNSSEDCVQTYKQNACVRPYVPWA